MNDLLAIGAAGVRAFQAALTQVGDNVANADSPGYVRRSLRLATGPAGAGTPLSRDASGGAAVVTGAIIRSSDALATNAARVAAGSHARYAARADWLDRLQTVVTGSDLDARLGGFFDAGTDLAATPTSTAARAIFLDRTDQATTAFRVLGTGLAGLAEDVASATDAATTRINAVTDALGAVNRELRRTAAGGSAASGLLDNRDSLLAELATAVRITVTEGPRGVVTVRLGTSAGPALVTPEGNSTRIGAQHGSAGAEIILDPTHDADAVQLPASGALAGLLDAASRIATARAEIDALATRFGTEINAWHAQGTDALGDPGDALVAMRGLDVQAGRANAGVAAIDVRFSDDLLLHASGYALTHSAGVWTLARVDGSASTSGTGPLALDGVTISPGGGARDGDSWALGIVEGAAGLGLRATGTARLAVADRFITDAAATNTGGAALVLTTDAMAAGLASPPPYTVIVSAPGLADIIDSASGTILASLPLDGNPIIAAGLRINVFGSPAVGDSFRIFPSNAASNDNGNIRKLSDIRGRAGAGGTLETSLDAQAAAIGTALSESRRLETTAAAVMDDTARAADAVSGVDLDREAADLTRLQVAYRANAQLLTAARDMFDALLAVLQ